MILMSKSPVPNKKSIAAGMANFITGQTRGIIYARAFLPTFTSRAIVFS